MKRTVWLWELIGFAITSVFGTLLHFLYEWCGESVWVAPFSGVNESTWEHMKLLFWPAFIFAIIQSFFFRGCPNFWCAKLRGTLLGLVLIPALFYTYNGAVARSPDWLNIAIFFISAAAAYIYEARLLRSDRPRCKAPTASFLALCAVGVLFTVFTFLPPKLGIFIDPVA